MSGFWKQQGRLILIVSLVVIAGLVLLAWALHSGPEKSPFFYDAR